MGLGFFSLTIPLWLPVQSSAAAGDFDPSFGAGGSVSTTVGTGSAEPFAVRRQFDGKLVVAGSAQIGAVGGFALARYGPSGTLDAAFGGDGVVTTTIGPDVADARDLVLQADGKLVAAGSVETEDGRNFALVRYAPDGSLDPGFGTGGVVTTDLGSESDAAFALVLQPDGKLVAAGSSDAGGSTDFALVRYNPNGSLDSTFGTGGIVLTSFGSGSDFAFALLRQPDGKLVVAGSSQSGATSSFGLARYLSNGSLDPSFGSGGLVTTPIGQFDAATGLVRQSDGKLVAAGLSQGVTGTDFSLARYAPDGSLDGTFGDGGIVRTSFGAADSQALDLVLQPDGKLVGIGQATGAGGGTFALARYRTNGTLDPTFGNGGRVVASVSAGDDGAFAGLVQPDGRLVVTGAAGEDFGLARLFLGGCGDATVGTGEECDDGNSLDGDGCTSLCLAESCATSPNGLAAWWTGDGDASDLVGSHDGILRGGAGFLPGRAAEAFSFDGVDDYIEVPDDALWDFGTGSFSVELWVLFAATPSEQTLVARNEEFNGSCGSVNGWSLRLAGGRLVFRVSAPGSAAVDVASAPWTPLPGDWHHVVVTVNGGSVSLYLDGDVVATGSGAGSLPALSAPLLLGQSGECATPSYLRGVLDEVGVFTRALAPAEIDAIFAAGSGARCKICGDGVVTAGEACDEGGETATCDADCTASECGDGLANAAAGEACDDSGESAACDADCTAVSCADGTLNTTAGEQCEDGNVLAGDCCSALCRFEAAGSSCAGGGDACTVNACDGAGSCVGGKPTDCRQAGKSILVFKKRGGDQDKLVWKWLRGEAISLEDFGNPLASADHALCVYQGAGLTPFARAEVAADGVNWNRAGSTGFRYSDAARAPDGVEKIVLKSGAAGKPKVIVKAKGANLPEMALPFELPVVLQLVNGETNVCWETSFDSGDVKKNVAEQFKAKATGP